MDLAADGRGKAARRRDHHRRRGPAGRWGSAGGAGNRGAAAAQRAAAPRADARHRQQGHPPPEQHRVRQHAARPDGTELRFGEGFVNEEAEGFDNIATALSMSPRQVEDYFAAAREVSATCSPKPALRARIVTCDPAAEPPVRETVIGDFGARAFRRPLDGGGKRGPAREVPGGAGRSAWTRWGRSSTSCTSSWRRPSSCTASSSTRTWRTRAPHPLDGYELASRLSYALWSSMPDDALFAQAAAASSRRRSGSRRRSTACSSDGRSEMLVKNFAARWFGSKRLPTTSRARLLFPRTTPQLAASMQREMELYFSEFLYGRPALR